MFDWTSGLTVQVMRNAFAEVRRRGHDTIGEVDVLLSLLRLPDTLAGELLVGLGVDPRVLLARVQALAPASGGAVPLPQHVPFSPRAKAMLMAGMEAAMRSGCDSMDTGHLLLGLIEVAEGPLRFECDRVRLTAAALRRALSAWFGVDHADLEGGAGDSAIEGGDSATGHEECREGRSDQGHRLGNPSLELFTLEAKRAVAHARYEAKRRGHDGVDVAHVLLALLGEPTPLVGKLLAAVGATAGALRRGIEELLVPGAGTELPTAQLPLTPAAQAMIELAADIASRLAPLHPGGGHLLVAIVANAEPALATILAAAGVSDSRPLVDALAKWVRDR